MIKRVTRLVFRDRFLCNVLWIIVCRFLLDIVIFTKWLDKIYWVYSSSSSVGIRLIIECMWFRENFAHDKIIQYLQIKLCTWVYGLLRGDCLDDRLESFHHVSSCYVYQIQYMVPTLSEIKVKKNGTVLNCHSTLIPHNRSRVPWTLRPNNLSLVCTW
jgi:hypothetical protein